MGIQTYNANTQKGVGTRKTDEIVPTVAALYPMGAERELTRVHNAYMNTVYKMMKPEIMELLKEYQKQSRADARFDDFASFRSKVSEKLGNILDKFSTAEKALTERVRKTGQIAKNSSLKNWIDMVRQSLGTEPTKEYYEEDMDKLIRQWTKENVSKVSSIPVECLSELQDIILWGYQTHQPLINVYRRIEKRLQVNKSKARMLGRDQMGTLSAQITKKEHESMGVKKYMWRTKRDNRVRECHAVLDKKIFSWDNPPEMWYRTKAGIVYTGRRCHPSEDYGCRCTAVPVFDKEQAKEQLKKMGR